MHLPQTDNFMTSLFALTRLLQVYMSTLNASLSLCLTGTGLAIALAEFRENSKLLEERRGDGDYFIVLTTE